MDMLKTIGWVLLGLVAFVAYEVFKPPDAVLWIGVLVVWLYWIGKSEREKEKAFQDLRNEVVELKRDVEDIADLRDKLEGLRKRLVALEAQVYFASQR